MTHLFDYQEPHHKAFIKSNVAKEILKQYVKAEKTLKTKQCNLSANMKAPKPYCNKTALVQR